MEAGFTAAQPIPLLAVTRESDEPRRRPSESSSDVAREFVAIHDRKPDVEDGEIGLEVVEGRERTGTLARGDDLVPERFQEFGHEFKGVEVVIHGEAQREAAAPAAALALGVDLSAMEFGDLADQREADAEAARRPRRGLAPLDEEVEDARQKFGGDACTVVRDRDDEFRAVDPRCHLDLPSSLTPWGTSPPGAAPRYWPSPPTRCSRPSKHARLDNSHEVELRRIIAVDLLIVDDFGLDTMDAQESRDAHEIFIERHRAGSMIVTSNRGPDEWHATFHEPMRAQAAIDRFTSAADDLVVEGESYRSRQKPRSP